MHDGQGNINWQLWGWRTRTFVPFSYCYVPALFRQHQSKLLQKQGYWVLFLGAILSFTIALYARLLEAPYWNDASYALGEEFLLATHDAYHWIAGAEGFEFGAGHPMSELLRSIAGFFATSIPNTGFWLAPVMGALTAVAVYLWAWGLGFPFAGLCAGVLTALSPAFWARTLLGCYDTDLVVLPFAVLLGLVPALWLSPWLISPAEWLGRLVQRVWAVACLPQWGNRQCSHAKTQDSSGLCTNETREYRQKKRFTATLAMCMRVVWAPAMQTGPFTASSQDIRMALYSPQLFILLILSGVLGYWVQEWHSLFPYLIRCSAVTIPALLMVLGPYGARYDLLCVALLHIVPLLLGVPGCIIACLWWYMLFIAWRLPMNRTAPVDAIVTGLAQKEESLREGSTSRPSMDFFWAYGKTAVAVWLQQVIRQGNEYIALRRTQLLCSLLLWACVAYAVLDGEVLSQMRSSFLAYVDRSGDVSSGGTSVSDPLVFPSVAQSIIEVQAVALQEIFSYLYPRPGIIVVAIFLFLFFLCSMPVLLWFAPLLVLALLSVHMGGRMTMFGAPALMLPLAMGGGWFLQSCAKIFYLGAGKVMLALLRRYYQSAALRIAGGFSCACLLTFCLASPLIALLPDLTQGPLISRRHAEALEYIQHNTPQDSIVWNWWDWGYATHHFARRHTIADGARHGGPSLYLPAAVYTTADPRFARQLIKYTAAMGNAPGKVFAGLSATQAQALMERLGNKQAPLIEAPGKQYLVVGLEHLRLGFWITKYGSWNFVRKSGPGALMNNLSMSLEFNMQNGKIISGQSMAVQASSISVFEPSGLSVRRYSRGTEHFIFNLDDQREHIPLPSHGGGALTELQQILLGAGHPPVLANDKIVVDDVFFHTLMVQMLLAAPDDPRFRPYFKLRFDNTYTRVYEVL